MCKAASSQMTTNNDLSSSTSLQLRSFVCLQKGTEKAGNSHGGVLHRDQKSQVPNTPLFKPRDHRYGTLTCLKRKYATTMTVEPRKDKEAQACATWMIACCFACGIPAVLVSRSRIILNRCCLEHSPIKGQTLGVSYTHTRTQPQPQNVAKCWSSESSTPPSLPILLL